MDAAAVASQRRLCDVMSIELCNMLAMAPGGDQRDLSIKNFFAAVKQLRIEAPSAAVTAFVRLAMQEPAADVPARLLDCWQTENAAISSVGELRGVVAQLRAFEAVPCQEERCMYAFKCFCRLGGGG
jgi:hypothetical protein